MVYVELIAMFTYLRSDLTPKGQEMCERGVGPWGPFPNNPYVLCRRKADFELLKHRVLKLCESRGGRPGFPVPNSPYGLCRRKATLKQNKKRIRPDGCGL